MSCYCNIVSCGVCDELNHTGRIHDCETCGRSVCDECYYCVHDFGRCKDR